MKLDKDRFGDILAFWPVHGEDGGNATAILLRSGERVLDERGIRAVRAALLFAYMVDARAQRAQVGEILGRQAGALPLVLGGINVFAAFKMAAVKVDRNDRIHGYVCVRRIRGIDVRRQAPFVLVAANEETVPLPLNCTPDTALRQLNDAKRLRKHLELAEAAERNKRHRWVRWSRRL